MIKQFVRSAWVAAACAYGSVAFAAGGPLGVKTVSTYRTRLMEKMALASNSDLTYYALKNTLID